jgi:hypothetical protein
VISELLYEGEDISTHDCDVLAGLRRQVLDNPIRILLLLQAYQDVMTCRIEPEYGTAVDIENGCTIRIRHQANVWRGKKHLHHLLIRDSGPEPDEGSVSP